MDLRAGETLPLAFLAGFDSLSKVKLKMKVRSPKPVADTLRSRLHRPELRIESFHFHTVPHRNENENENLNFFFYIYTLFVLGNREIVGMQVKHFHLSSLIFIPC